MPDLPENGSRIPDNPHWMNYHAGGVDIHGRQIAVLLHRSPACAVYIPKTEEDIGWDADGEFCIDAVSSVAEASSLLNELRSGTRRPRILNRGCRIIGVELARALQERTEDDTRDFFVGGRQFVEASLREHLHLSYLVAAFVTTCVVSTVCIGGVFSGFGSKSFLVAAALGGVGALMSVTQRFRRIPIEHYSSGLYTYVAGISRILVGSVFGGVFLLFQKAGLLLAMATDQSFLLYAAAFAAGFSERMIPEILDRFETTVGGDDSSKTT